MRKISTTHDLQAELRLLLEYAQSPRPSRAVLATRITLLSERVAKTASAAPFVLKMQNIGRKPGGMNFQTREKVLEYLEFHKILEQKATRSVWLEHYEGGRLVKIEVLKGKAPALAVEPDPTTFIDSPSAVLEVLEQVHAGLKSKAPRILWEIRKSPTGSMLVMKESGSEDYDVRLAVSFKDGKVVVEVIEGTKVNKIWSGPADAPVSSIVHIVHQQLYAL